MRTVIVSGASGNLGQAVTDAFLAAGDRVIGTVLPGDPVEVERDHPDFHKQELNLTNEGAVSAFIDDLESRYGKIDICVATAGGFAAGSIEETDMEALHKMITLNFETTYNLSRAVFRNMKKNGSGKIFLTGARTGLDMKYAKGMTAYGISKSMIFRLAELMNMEGSGSDIVTSVIVPSTIDTPQNRESMPSADFSKWTKPEDIAALILMHCSKPADVLRETVLKVYNRS